MKLCGKIRKQRVDNLLLDVIMSLFMMVIRCMIIEKTECIFFYGGQGDKGRSLADFYILNVKSFNWKRLFLLEMPQSRHHHTISDIGNFEREKIIFGGTC